MQENFEAKIWEFQRAIYFWRFYASDIAAYEREEDELSDKWLKVRDIYDEEGMRVFNASREDTLQRLHENRMAYERELKSMLPLTSWIAYFENKTMPSIDLELKLVKLIAEVNLNGAIALVRKGITQFNDDLFGMSNDVRLRNELVDLLDKAGKTDDLVSLLREDLQKSPTDLILKQRIAHLFLKANRKNEAFDFLEKEFKKYPDNLELRNSLIGVMYDAGQSERAVSILKEQLNRTPGNREIQFCISKLLRSVRQMNEAVTFLDEEIKKSSINKDLGEYLYTFFVETLQCEHLDNCLSTINFLQERYGKRAISPLSELFEQTNCDELSIRALEALVSIQQKAAIPSLWKALGYRSTEVFKSIEVRKYAARMLGELGDSSIVEELVKDYKIEEKNIAVSTIKDETILEAIWYALNKLDNRPRTLWEKLIGRRSWVQ